MQCQQFSNVMQHSFSVPCVHDLHPVLETRTHYQVCQTHSLKCLTTKVDSLLIIILIVIKIDSRSFTGNKLLLRSTNNKQVALPSTNEWQNTQK